MIRLCTRLGLLFPSFAALRLLYDRDTRRLYGSYSDR